MEDQNLTMTKYFRKLHPRTQLTIGGLKNETITVQSQKIKKNVVLFLGIIDAELEEKDALRIQKEMLNNFKESEFDRFFQTTSAPQTKQSDFDFSGFSAEFRRLGSLISTVIDPLIKVDKSAHSFISHLHRLYTGYRTCFLFAEYLQSTNNLNSNHEVLKRLEEYRAAVESVEQYRNDNWEAAEHFLLTRKPLVKRSELVEGVGKKVHFADEVEDEESNKRQITSEMLKNVGQLASRSRKARTPRTKNRKKYEKGAKKHRSQVAQMRDQAYKYTGEPTGIRKGVVKSTKFR